MNKTHSKPDQVLSLLFRYQLTRHIILWSVLIYTMLYLWAVGDLNFHTWQPTLSFTWTEDPLSLLFRQRNRFYFEGIAIVEFPLATYLFSPVNITIGLLLALLVGLNLAVSVVSIKYAKRNIGHTSATLLVSIPALLAGTTCSAPVILVLLGIQASAAVLAFFNVLVPIAFVFLTSALVFNLFYFPTEGLQITRC